MPPRRNTSGSADQPAPAGRLTHQYGRPNPAQDAVAISRDSCRITVEYTEGGELKVEISGRVEYFKSAFVGASISSAADEIPTEVLDELRAALSEVLDEAHETLKNRLDGEVRLAAGAHSDHPSSPHEDDE